MFRTSYNRAVFRIRIETVTPLLIRAGDTGLDPTAASLACVRTRHARHGSTVYIPGSSLKGVLRSAAEALVRGRTIAGIPDACDPLDEKTSCGARSLRDKKGRDKQQGPILSSEVHRGHCLACRLFGSVAMKGRASVRDLFPWDDSVDETATSSKENRERREHANDLELRNGVSINRVTGSVQNGPFDQELVPAGVSFWGEIALENYQVWQVGLMAGAFDEVNQGFAQLGSSKSRGLGVAKVHIISAVHEQRRNASALPRGVGALASAEEIKAYGLLAPEKELRFDKEPELRGLSMRFVAEKTNAETWLSTGIEALGDLAP